MNRRVERVSQWCYQGLWGVLTRWFRVPDRPPELPTFSGEQTTSFQPAEGFLGYLKLKFWIGLVAFDLFVLVAWLVILFSAPPIVSLLTLPIALAVAIVPDVVAYLAIHLRYDTTWYVMSDRSLRIRRGIWIIRETTITFENVQNVTVRQGPVQRWFGIADLLVETAGGGAAAQQAQHGGQSMTAHQGLIEGIDDAARIRDLMLNRLRKSQTAGLGDDLPASPTAPPDWSPAHLETLREILAATRALP